MLVSIGQPSLRLPLLLEPHLNWEVSILLLPSPAAAARQAPMNNKYASDALQWLA
jgi:hypothetical protein